MSVYIAIYFIKDDCTWRRVLGPFWSLLLRFFLNLVPLLLKFLKSLVNFQHDCDTLSSFYVFLLITFEKRRFFAYLPLIKHTIDINILKRWSWHYQNGTKIRLAWITMPCIKFMWSILYGTSILLNMVSTIRPRLCKYRRF